MEPVFFADAAERVLISPANKECPMAPARPAAILALLLASILGAVNVNAQAGESLDGRLAVAKSEMAWNMASNTFDSTVTITNISTTVIAGPLLLTIKNITAAGVTVANSTGVDANNNPQVPTYLTFGVLRPRGKVTIVVKFSSPNGGLFDYSVVASGSIMSNGAPASMKMLPGGYFSNTR